MTDSLRTSPNELLLARLLSFGTWLSAAVILMGLIVTFTPQPKALDVGHHIVSAGIGLLISLPPLRVIFVLGAFVRKRDYPFVTFAATVLIVIGLGLALGAGTSRCDQCR